MFIDQLSVPITFQQDAEIIEPTDDALEFDAVNKENRDGNFTLADMIEKCVLKVLFFITHLRCISPRFCLLQCTNAY